MEYIAWLNSSPKEFKGFTRRDVIRDPQMPDLGYGAHLLNYIVIFDEVTYTEIANYCKLSGDNIPGWKAKAMVMAMKAYRNMQQSAKDRNCPSPLIPEEDRNTAIADSMWSTAKSM